MNTTVPATPPIWRCYSPRYLLLVAFIAICALGGGSSWPDAAPLLFVRPAAVLLIMALLIAKGGQDWRPVKPLLILLGLFAGSMAIQLIPLPPALWLAMPGHERYVQAVATAGASQPWRPISLTPDLTLNSLVALLPALAAICGFASIGEQERGRVVPVLIALGFASAALGTVQIISGPQSLAYFHSRVDNTLPVGFFANRNHQAVLLACLLPLLATWAMAPGNRQQHVAIRLGIAAAIGLFFLAVILISGSRAGTILGVLNLFAVIAMVAIRRRPGQERAGGPAKLIRYGLLAAIPVLVIGLVVFAGRTSAIDRILGSDDTSSRLRAEATPVVWQITKTFFPFGSGFGGFDQVYRGFEPDSLLSPQFFNRAHNDLLETAMGGGAPALLVLVLFLLWAGRQSIAAWRTPSTTAGNVDGARAGSLMILTLLLASLVDYPIRTPLLTVVLTIACCWLAIGSAPRDAEPGRA